MTLIQHSLSCLCKPKTLYIGVEPFHLFRYLDEQAFRYNNRKAQKDLERFIKVLKNVSGRRVTYKKLTRKEGETTEF